jgi:hypothetical protein
MLALTRSQVVGHRSSKVASCFGSKRQRVSLSLETRYDNDTLKYVAIVVHPDGRRETERFDRRESFRAWIEGFEKRLADERWAADGGAHILPDGWPDRPR